MKRLAISVWCLALGMLSSDACTGFYVGRKVSVDGTTLIGRTMDFTPWNGMRHLNRFEPGERTYFDGLKNKYAFICTSFVDGIDHGIYGDSNGFYGGEIINDQGVMMSATVTGRTKDEALEADPYVPVPEGGVGESNICDYMIGNAATAREAVEILVKAIAERGHAGPETYAIADSNEAWYVEVYTGHEWAAVRLPEDKVAVYGNQFNLREFSTNKTEGVMYSPGLVELAEKHGFIVWKDKEKGIIDLYETYSPPLFDYSNYRTFWGHHAWAPTQFPADYKTENIYPLLFDPEPGLKLSVTNIFEMMRTRYEGVNCPEETGDTSVRLIGTSMHRSCDVLQMRHELPVDYRCTLWECFSQAEHSTFLPICMATRDFPEAYTRNEGGKYDYDPHRAADAFLRLNTLAAQKRFVVDTHGVRRDVRPYYGAGVRAFWRAQENRLVEEWPRKLKEWNLQGRAGRIMANAYVNFNQVWTLADAKRLHDEFIWYMAEFGCDQTDGEGATDVPTYPFASSMPTNAEQGRSWTRWHRAEFDVFIEKLAGPVAMRSPKVAMLVEKSKHVFDNVKDADTLAAAKAAMADVVRDMWLSGGDNYGIIHK